MKPDLDVVIKQLRVIWPCQRGEFRGHKNLQMHHLSKCFESVVTMYRAVISLCCRMKSGEEGRGNALFEIFSPWSTGVVVPDSADPRFGRAQIPHESAEYGTATAAGHDFSLLLT